MNVEAGVDSILQLDRMIHEPARLMILSILAGADAVEFGFIESLTGLSKGNLSSHMSKLEDAALVTVQKTFRGKRPLTALRITAEGRRALLRYRSRLEEVIATLPEARPGSGSRAKTRG